MDKNEVLKILETAKDKNGEVPMRLVRQAFEKLPESCEDTISRRAAIEWCRPEDWGTPDERWRPESKYGAMIEALPSAQPEQSESEDITFWKKRAREYEEMVLKLTDEMARGIKIDSVLITEEGIVFKKKKQEQRWILCEKRMPETDDEVLITVLDMEDDYVEVYKGFYQDHEWWTQWCHGCLKIKDEPCGVNIVTAWMPLPDPYREEGETDG